MDMADPSKRVDQISTVVARLIVPEADVFFQAD